MGTLFGFVVGYVLGAKAGSQGFDRVVQAWNDLRSSDEFRDFLALLRSHTRGTLREAADRLGNTGDEPSPDDVVARARARLQGDDTQ